MDAHLPLPPSPAAGPDAAPATPTSEHGGSARSSNHEEETQFRAKHANPVLVIRAKGASLLLEQGHVTPEAMHKPTTT